MGHWASWRGPEGVAACASFILLLKIRRSSSMSVKPAGGALRLLAWRIAGILKVSLRDGVYGRKVRRVVFLLQETECGIC